MTSLSEVLRLTAQTLTPARQLFIQGADSQLHRKVHVEDKKDAAEDAEEIAAEHTAEDAAEDTAEDVGEDAAEDAEEDAAEEERDVGTKVLEEATDGAVL